MVSENIFPICGFRVKKPPPYLVEKQYSRGQADFNQSKKVKEYGRRKTEVTGILSMTFQRTSQKGLRPQKGGVRLGVVQSYVMYESKYSLLTWKWVGSILPMVTMLNRGMS